MQEYGAFYRSVDTRLNAKNMVGRVDRRYFLGVDFALSNDGTACALCHFEPEFEEKLKYFPEEIHSYYKNLNQEFIDEDTVIFGGKFDLELSEGVKALLQNNATYEDFTELGYSEGVVYDLLIF